MVYGRCRHLRTAGASSRKALAKLVVLLANDEIASSVTLLISQLNSAFAIRFLWESFSSDNPAVLLHTVHCDFSSHYPQALHAVGVALPAHNALRLFFSQLLLHARVFSKISARHTHSALQVLLFSCAHDAHSQVVLVLVWYSCQFSSPLFSWRMSSCFFWASFCRLSRRSCRVRSAARRSSHRFSTS